MLFVTNRRLEEGPRSRPGRRVRFDLSDSEPSPSLFFCERRDAEDYVELTSTPFFNRLRRGPRSQILFYLHGFNSQPETDIFPTAVRLQDLLDGLTGARIEVVPLIWPCDDDFGLLKDYWDDQDAAEMSGFAFGRAIGKFLDWRDAPSEDPPCLKHVNVLAHSMGNRVLRFALGKWSRDRGAPPALFRNLFLMAADIANESLEPGEPGHAITRAARNVLVYHADDDFALRTSKLANLRRKVVTRRLGHTGPENPERTPRNVVAVDCDAVNNRYDPLGHTYFLDDGEGRPGLVLAHVAETLTTGRPAGFAAGQRSLRLAEEPSSLAAAA